MCYIQNNNSSCSIYRIPHKLQVVNIYFKEVQK